MIKNGFISYIVKYIAAVSLFTVLLFASALIPRKTLASNMLTSAEFLCNKEMFGYIWEGVDASIYDRYADSILLNIAWNYESDNPVRSVVESSFYHTDSQGENLNFYDAVTSDLDANLEYVRYWHGSISVVRPLLVIMPIQDMYIFLAVILLILFLTLIWRLRSLDEKALIVAVTLGMMLTYSWFVPFSLEYIWTYLITLVVSHLIINKDINDSKYISILMITGILTAYMDFLTTETLTLTIPLMISIKIRGKNDDRFIALKSAIAWGIGYVGMFIFKWLLASIILGGSIKDHVLGHVEERVGGVILDEAYFGTLGPIWKNISTMIPFSLGRCGVIAGILIILICIYMGYIYHGKTVKTNTVVIYAVCGLIPLVRFLTLRNHSVIHYFFTFRALMATVMAIVMIMTEVFDMKLFRDNWRIVRGKRRCVK